MGNTKPPSSSPTVLNQPLGSDDTSGTESSNDDLADGSLIDDASGGDDASETIRTLMIRTLFRHQHRQKKLAMHSYQLLCRPLLLTLGRSLRHRLCVHVPAEERLLCRNRSDSELPCAGWWR